MRRGDIYLVEFEPVVGAEANKARPAVVVSNDAANRVAAGSQRGVVTVVPLTSNTERIYQFQTLVAAGDGGLVTTSKAQAEQVRSVDVRRLRQRLGTVKGRTLVRIEHALRIHLDL